MMRVTERILVSACLLGIPCRYDGASKANEAIVQLLENPKIVLIPVCPEQLGGMATPRCPSERVKDGVRNAQGADTTDFYKKGAVNALKIAELYEVKRAILKAKSPSCGSGLIYDGTFMKQLTSGDGVTTELFKQKGLVVASEKDFTEKFSDLVE